MSLTSMVLSLARCRSQQERRRILQQAAHDKRFNPDQQTEIRRLVEESSLAPGGNVQALRPILNPADVCNLLIPLRPGPKPVLSATIDALVDEWVVGWREEGRLREANLPPPGPLLLAGPTGCGKTTLTHYLADRLTGVRAGVVLEAHRMVDSLLGASGANVAKSFEAVEKNSGLVVLEEIDALAQARSNGDSGGERENNRISVALMRVIENSPAAIVATTNRLDALDTALLRRFEYVVRFDLPDEQTRRAVLTRFFPGEVPACLVELPLTESIRHANRVRRLMALRKLSAEDALAVVKAA